MPRMPGFEPGAALGEGEGAHVLVAVDEQIVEAHEGRIVAQHLGGDGLAVEPLLQVVERGDDAVAHDQQFAVEHRVEWLEGGDDLREACRDVVARAREDAHLAAPGGDLHAHAVPFPFGGNLVGVEPGPIAFLDRMRQHQRAENGLALGAGARAAVLEPGEEVGVGRRQRVPDLLDVGQRVAAHLRQRRLGEARRDTDARRAAEQLQQRPAPAHVEPVEEVADDRARRCCAGPAPAPQRPRRGEARVARRGLSGHSSETVSAVSPT